MPQDTPIPLGLCQCGCGLPTRVAKSTSRQNGRVKGQPFRFITGHNWRKLPPNRYEDRGDHVALFLTRADGTEFVCLVDREDFALVRPFRWCVSPHEKTWYARTSVTIDGRRRKVLMHRMILGTDEAGRDGDHWDGNGLDNRRRNLRPASRTQNNSNARLRKDNTAGFKGVHPYGRNGRFYATIKVDGTGRYLGSFDAAEDAARAYDEAARRHFGEFARLNFPRDGEQPA